MTERTHDVLDGLVAADSLDAAERRDLEVMETAIGGALEALPNELAPDLSVAVLWRVRELEPAPEWLPEPLVGAWTRLLVTARWFWAPRAVRLRPAFALAALVAAAGLPMAALQLQPTAGSSEPVRMLVQFRLGTEAAQNVSLVGDFTGWESQVALEQVSPGVWSIALPLEPGIYEYAFVVDGERWTLDPLAPAVADGFGGANSRVAVFAPERGTAL